MTHRSHRIHPPIRRSTAAEPAPLSIPWWTRGDTNAFFGLGFNILVNVLTLTGLMIGVVEVPAGDVLGTVLPALGVALILGNLYYTFLARRLAQAREPHRRHGFAVRAERAAHVHRRVRGDAAGLPEHQGRRCRPGRPVWRGRS